ncbi:MAG: 3-keto-disaccharide hydrolase, partial [Aeoliella sp.]
VKELLKEGDWNSMTIVAKGASYTVWLNGKMVMTYDSETAVKEGPVGIQLHAGREMAIDYRDIRLAELR